MSNAVTQGDKRVELADRAQFAEWGLAEYQAHKESDDDLLTACIAMITDLLHLADQSGMNHAPDFLAMVLRHYDAERAEAGLPDYESEA